MTEPKIVEKEWGEEQWIVNREYCGQRLLLRQGYRSSLHCHKIKDETFYLLAGTMKVEVGTDPENLAVSELTKGDILHLAPNTWHRFTGLTDVEFMEFSTHHDDEDSIRLTHSERVPEDEV